MSVCPSRSTSKEEEEERTTLSRFFRAFLVVSIKCWALGKNFTFNVATKHWMWIYRCDGAHMRTGKHYLLRRWPWKMRRSCCKSFMHSTKWSPESGSERGERGGTGGTKLSKMCKCARAHASIYRCRLCNLRGQISYVASGSGGAAAVTHDIAVVSQQLLLHFCPLLPPLLLRMMINYLKMQFLFVVFLLQLQLP